MFSYRSGSGILIPNSRDGVGNNDVNGLADVVVLSNVVYQICAKSVPKDMDTMASMTITYLVGAGCSAVLFFAMNKNADLLREYGKMNWDPSSLAFLSSGWRSASYTPIKTVGL